jgi:hypothetical protein
MYPQQLAEAARAAAAADMALQRLAAPEDHHRTQIAGALAALERLDDKHALCALAQTSAELAAALGHSNHARIVEALCDLHAAAVTLAARSRETRARRTTSARARGVRGRVRE